MAKVEAPKARFEWERESPGVACTAEEGRTKSEFAQEVDINYLVKRFTRTGDWPEERKSLQYVDLTMLPQTYHENLEAIRQVKETFNNLPAEVREFYRHDPALFLDDLEKDRKALQDAEEAHRREVEADKAFEAKTRREARKASEKPPAPKE